jgi:hypothetical protein
MWQPTPAHWRLIWIAAAVSILAWPAQNGSLAVKAVNWAADPFQQLPATPSPLALGRGDDMEAVQHHDAEEAAYYAMYNGSRLARVRFMLRDLEDPFDPSTERQILVGLGIVLALLVWRQESRERAA